MTTKTKSAKVAPAEPRKVGRPPTGKRSNKEVYRQVSAWVRRDTYTRVQDRLYVKENRREFSDLVQTLLEAWLKTR